MVQDQPSRTIEATASKTDDGFWLVQMLTYPNACVRVVSLDDVGATFRAVLRHRQWGWSSGADVRIVSYR